MPVIFQQNWTALQTNTGISSTANIEFTPHGGTARDGDYPLVGKTDTVKIVHNGVRNVLTANSNWVNAGVVWDRIGSIAGNGNYPNYFDAQGPLIAYADYTITSASLAACVFTPVVGLHRTAGSSDSIKLSVSFYSSAFHADLFALQWSGGNINTDSVTIPQADLENKRIRFQIAWTCGTMDAGATTVDSDGSLVASMIDLDTEVETILYSYTNIPLYVSYNGENLGGGSSISANNHLAVGSVGYVGLIGENETFVIYSLDALEPEPGELMGAIPEPCCGSDGPNPGPIEDPLDATWTPICTGGGTVPTAADLTDAENWDD